MRRVWRFELSLVEWHVCLRCTFSYSLVYLAFVLLLISLVITALQLTAFICTCLSISIDLVWLISSIFFRLGLPSTSVPLCMTTWIHEATVKRRNRFTLIKPRHPMRSISCRHVWRHLPHRLNMSWVIVSVLLRKSVPLLMQNHCQGLLFRGWIGPPTGIQFLVEQAAE